jgi:hypothetical protein
MKHTRHILSALGLLVLLASTHCSSGFSNYCEKERDCRGGNDNDVDACVEQFIAAENIASAYDCGDQFDAAADCLENATCNAKDQRLENSACATQQKALSDCQKAASARK